MEKLKDLLKRSFNLLVKKRWLKEINRAVDRYNKSRDRLLADTHVLTELVKRYNELHKQYPLRVKRTNVCQAEWQFWEGWMSNHDMRIDDATCSNCGYKHPTVCRTYGAKETEQEVLSKLFKFCPNCGKYMAKNNI